MKKMYKKPITESLPVQTMTNICDGTVAPIPGRVEEFPGGGGTIDDVNPNNT